MTRRPAPLTSLRRALSLRERPRRGEDGFILLESIVAISLVTVLMGALASFTLNAIQATTELRARQGAVQLATSAMATISALPPSDLVRGRGESAVVAQWGSAATKVKPLLRAMAKAFDDTAPLPPATLPLTPTTQTFNGIVYRTSTYVGTCNLRTPGSSATATECVETGTGPQHLRVVLAVEWSNRACRGGGCVYTTTSLVNAAGDPVFNSNRANPPVPPVIVDPGNQVSTIGRPQDLQLSLETGSGLAPHTWESVTLPTGLGVGSSTGVVSGIPTVLGGPTAVTVRVSDVFGRADTATFGWTVVAEPTITTPGSRSTVRGQAVSLAVTSTCPNAPCTYAAAGLPAGLGVNTANGTVSGTPTTSGTSSVTITVTDSDGAAVSTNTFTWAVVDPLAVSSPGTLGATVGATVSVPIDYTCSAGPCTITLAGTVPGVGLSLTSPVTTANTATTLSRPTGTGTVYLTGVVQGSAVPTGSVSRRYTPSLTIANGGTTVSSGAGAWTITLRPTLSAVGSRSVGVGGVPSAALEYTCPSAPCTLVLGSTVPGVGLSTTPNRAAANTTTSLTLTAARGTVYVTGLVSTSATPTNAATSSRAWTVSLTLSDDNDAPAPVTTTGTWTATNAARINNPGSQAVEPNQNFALQLNGSCFNGGCGWSASAVSGGVTYPLAISATGRLTFNGVPAGTYTVNVRLSDAAANQTDTASFTVTVQNFTLTIPSQISARPPAGSTGTALLDVAALVTPRADGYTYTLTGAPSWLSIDGEGLLTATITSTSLSDTSITVTATSTTSPTSTVSSTFSWTLQ